MSEVVGEAVLRIRVDDTTVDKETTAAGKKAGKSFSTGFGSSLKIAAAVGAGLAIRGIAGYAKTAVSEASDLNETISKTEVVFNRASGRVLAFASNSATALGQTKQQALDAAATFGTFGKAAGLSGRPLAKFSTQFTGLATDLASFNNTSPEEAIDAIGAALRGETEPIRRYGVLLDDASLRQEALRQGLVKTTKDALTPQNKTLAASALIMRKTKDAQGDFARTSGGLANQQRILSASFVNLRARIGTAFLPLAVKLVTFGNTKLVPMFERAVPHIEDFGAAVSDIFSDDPTPQAQEFRDAISGIDAGELADSLKSLGESAADLGPAIASIGADTLADGIDVFSVAIGFAADHTDLLAKALPFLAAGFVAVKLAQAGANAAAVVALPTKIAEIAVNRQLVASNRALILSREGVTAATITETRATATNTATTAGAATGAGRAAGALKTFGKTAAVTGGAVALTAGLTEANVALSTLEVTAGAAAVGFAAGGPLGAAAAGSTALIFKLATAMNETSTATNKATEETSVYGDTLAVGTQAITGYTRALVVKKAEEDGTLELARKSQIATSTVTNALLGNAKAQKTVADRLAVGNKAAQDGVTYYDSFGNVVRDKTTRNLIAAAEAGDKLAQKIIDGTDALRYDIIKKNEAALAQGNYNAVLKGVPKSVQTRIDQIGLQKASSNIVSLTRKYDLTPEQVETVLRASGGRPTEAIIQGVINKANKVPPRTSTQLTADASQFVGEINNLREKLRGLFSFDPGRIQAGTQSWRGGLATVGEVGPERVILPKGSRVLTAAQTRQADAREGTGTGSTAVTIAPQITQNYYGPTTSGTRRRELEWLLKYGTNTRAVQEELV